MHWRRKWQPTPVFLPGESQGQGGKRGTAAAQGSTVNSLLTMISRIKDAPDLLSATTIAAEVARQATTLSDSDWERVKTLNDAAVAEAKPEIELSPFILTEARLLDVSTSPGTS